MSRLTKIELQNFMSLPSAVLEFDESGIISPVGYNDSGKSAITRALEVLWFDAYPQLQSKFITDDQPYFKIINYFDDGVVISRVKYAAGSSLWSMTLGDKVLYSNQLPNGTFAATKGVPEAISKYLGVAQDEATGEILNVRRNTNKLLLVATTGGENYKIFNNLCQGERLAYAVGSLNSDLNALNRQLTASISRLAGKKESLSALQCFSPDEEKALLAQSGIIQGLVPKLNMLISAAERLNSFADVNIADEVPIVDLSRLEMLCQADAAHRKAAVDIADEVPVFDLSRLEMLQSLSAMATGLSASVPDEVPVVDLSRLTFLIRLAKQAGACSGIANSISAQTEKYASIRQSLHECAEQEGWRICPNCGEVVIKEGVCC